MNRARAEELLSNALQPSEELRSQAEAEIKNLLVANFPAFLSTFGEIVLDSQAQPNLRMISSIIIKNALSASSRRVRQVNGRNWQSCPPDFRSAFKNALEMSLNIPEVPIRWNISRTLGSIITLESGSSNSSDHLQSLYGHLSDPSYAVGVLDTVTFVCEYLYGDSENCPQANASLIFKIATYYLSSPVADADVLKSALRCVFSAIDICTSVFESYGVRRDFLASLMSLSSSPPPVLELAIEALGHFVDIYHDLIEQETLSISSYVLSVMEGANSEVAIRCFEFWEVIADLKRFDIIKANLPQLSRLLLARLTDEDPEESAWTDHKGASALLAELTDTLGIDVLGEPVSQEFIRTKLASPDHSQRAIASVALGSICNSNHALFLRECLFIVIGEIGTGGPSEGFALYFVARACKKNIGAVLEILPTIIEKCKVIISTKRSVNATWVIYYLISACRSSNSPHLKEIFEYHYSGILNVLVNKMHTLTLGDANERNVLIDTLSDLISLCPESMGGLLDSLIDHFSEAAKKIIFSISNSPCDQFFYYEDMLSSCVILLQASASARPERRSEKSIRRVFEVLGEVLRTQENSAHGETYIALSKLIPLPADCLSIFVGLALKSIQSPHVFISRSALNFLSDCAMQLEERFSEYMQETVPALINTISSPEVALDLKPRIIEVFGEIALAVGKHFEPFIEMSTVLFSQIVSLDRSDNEEYVNQLYRAIIKMFSCIFIVLPGNRVLRGYIGHILDLVHAVASARMTGCDELIGDLLADVSAAFGPSTVRVSWVEEFLREGIESGKVRSERARSLYRAVK